MVAMRLCQSLSQMSFPDIGDISDIILDVPLSQPTQDASCSSGDSRRASGSGSGSTSFQSVSSLGKRRASDLSDFSPPPQITKASKLSPAERASPSLPDAPSDPVVIAHSPRYQDCFDNRGLAYGVQFEIARLISMGCLKYGDILVADLDALKGSNAEAAPKVAKVLLKLGQDNKEAQLYKTAFSKEASAKTPWKEFDLEEQALGENHFAGLGADTPHSEWYGGKVEFRATLKDVGASPKSPQYKIVLEKPELGHSTRFTRRFGSKSFFKTKVPKAILNRKDNRLTEFFMRPFVLCGRVFRGFTTKDFNVFMFMTNELFDGHTVFTPQQSTSCSLLEFLEWHNPLQINQRQTMRKWAARFALGLSNSLPLIALPLNSIEHVDDIISSSKSDMTDGAGYVNKALLLTLRSRLDLPVVPVAFQCRIYGAKGMLMLHPDAKENNLEQPKIYIRPSQIKIKYPPAQEPDPAMLVIDLLRVSSLRTPGRVSPETLICLSENRVPHGVFVKLMQDGLEQLISGFTKWEGKDAMFDLWAHVAHTGSVLSARMARETSGEARARGYGDRDHDEVEYEDEDELDTVFRQHSAAWWADQVSGCPSTLEETVLVLLDSGFTPQNCTVLREKLKQVLITNIKTFVHRYKIDVPMSCVAFLLPDPLGILGPDEVHIKSSSHNFKTPEGFETDIVLGDVLLTRNPCKVATDVRKFKAVERPELRFYTNVIVCSVQGERRLADLLAGGDYDGDTGLAIWQPEVVEPFRNADLKYSFEPPEVAGCFYRENETVSDFLQRMESESVDDKTTALQEVLFGGLRDNSMKGMYSTFQDNAIYSLGYCNSESVRLGYMFCKILDGAKTGLRVTREAFERDRAKYQQRSPAWKETPEDRERVYKSCSNDTNIRRPHNLGTFIMDTISDQAKMEGSRRTREVEKLFDSPGSLRDDSDLTAPWLERKKIAERYATEEKVDRLQRDLQKIEEHVQLMYAEHRQQLGAGSAGNRRDKAAFSELPIEARQDKIRALSSRFASSPKLDEVLMDEREVHRVRASYAYWYDSQQPKWSRFPWDVAMRELCAIKANALGASKTVTADFYERFNIKRRRH